MSQENVERAKVGLAALVETYRTGDIAPWARNVEDNFDREILVETGGAGAFTEGAWRGHAGAIGFVANQMEVLESMWISGEEIIDVDDDRLIVRINFGGRARHTGVEVSFTPTHVFDLHEGKVIRWRIFELARRPSKPPGCGSRPRHRGGSAPRSPSAEPRSNGPGAPLRTAWSDCCFAWKAEAGSGRRNTLRPRASGGLASLHRRRGLDRQAR